MATGGAGLSDFPSVFLTRADAELPEIFTGGVGLADFPNVFLTRADGEPTGNVHWRSRLVRFSKCFSDKGGWRASHRFLLKRSRLVRFSKCFSDKGAWRAARNVHGRSRLVRFSKWLSDKGGCGGSQKCSR